MLLQDNRLQCALLCLLIGVSGLLGPTQANDGDDFDLTFRKIYPCQETDYHDSNVSLHRSEILAVQANLTYCDRTWNISQYYVCCSI